MKLSLQSQIFLALIAFGALFAAVLGANEELFRRGLTDQRHLGLAHEVTLRAEDLERRGRAYAAVAPRDFEAYGRDVVVFYASLRADLDGLNGAVNALVQVHEASAPDTAKAIDAMRESHARFITGLWEKLGDNRDEPRLEWGAEFLGTEAPELRRAAQETEQAIASMAEQHLAESRNLTRLSWLLGVLAIGGIVVWFWRRVTRRIGLAASSCRQVSEGEFGTRIADTSRDELGEFSRAFNGLSSRTRVVLGVLDRLPDGATPEQAFSTLWSESQEYLGHRWQALFDVDAQLRDGQLLALNHHPSLDFAEAGQRFALAGIIDSMALDTQGAALLPDIRRHTLDQQQGRLLRELSRRDLRTLALVLLRDADGTPHRLLAFAWADADAENAGVARFLGGLSRFLGRLLVGGTPRPQQAEAAHA
jgi:HAMP domain-containing protein